MMFKTDNSERAKRDGFVLCVCKPNRVNARKQKNNKGCQFTGYKHKWEHRFSAKERMQRKVL